MIRSYRRIGCASVPNLTQPIPWFFPTQPIPWFFPTLTQPIPWFFPTLTQPIPCVSVRV